jgi:hypothetical protein
MLKAIGTLSTQQSQATEATMSAIVKFLNYAATHPNAELEYITSDMALWIDSDASYLSESKLIQHVPDTTKKCDCNYYVKPMLLVTLQIIMSLWTTLGIQIICSGVSMSYSSFFHGFWQQPCSTSFG